MSVSVVSHVEFGVDTDEVWFLVQVETLDGTSRTASVHPDRCSAAAAREILERAVAAARSNPGN